MSDQKRISPEEVVEAYRKTRLLPIRGIALGRLVACGCALGALYKREHPRASSSANALHWARLRYGESYVDGFACGFDGVITALMTNERRELGHADGRAAWDAVRGMNQTGGDK